MRQMELLLSNVNSTAHEASCILDHRQYIGELLSKEINEHMYNTKTMNTNTEIELYKCSMCRSTKAFDQFGIRKTARYKTCITCRQKKPKQIYDPIRAKQYEATRRGKGFVSRAAYARKWRAKRKAVAAKALAAAE